LVSPEHGSRKRAGGRGGELPVHFRFGRSSQEERHPKRRTRAITFGGRGPYVLQAAIASLHTEDPPDWPQIAALSRELARRVDSPVVRLNEAAAIAESGRPDAALELIDSLDLDGYHYLHAVRAEVLRRLGRADEARGAYDRALELVHSASEGRFLERRLGELEG
jgi:RNA polymerase sigma-70 factor (ECF subfamily)